MPKKKVSRKKPAKKKKAVKRKPAVRTTMTRSTKKSKDRPGTSEGKVFYAVKKIKSYKTKEGSYVQSHERTFAISWKTVALMAAGYLVTKWVKNQIKANVKDIAGLTKTQTKMTQTIGNLQNSLEKQQMLLEKIVMSQGFQAYAKKKGYEAVAPTEQSAEKLSHRNSNGMMMVRAAT